MTPDDTAILIAEYEQTRADERTFLNTLPTVYSVGVAMLVVLVAYATNSNSDVPSPLLALAPLLPLALFAYCASIGMSATIRSYHARSLETRLQELLSPETAPLAQWTTILSQVQSLRLRNRSPYGMINRGIWGTMIVAAIVTFGTCAVCLAAKVETEWRSLMAAFYTPMIVLIFIALYIGTQRGQRMYDSALTLVTNDRTRDERNDTKSVFGYFLVPRPSDFIKSLFLVLGLWAGTLAAASPRASSASEWVGLSLLAFVVLEVLAYQARYQWNDIRDAAEDSSHPRHSDRRRLPVGQLGLRPAVQLSTATLVLRMFTALAIACGNWFGLRNDLIFFAVLLWVLACIYEARRATRSPRWTAGIVTLGYPLRVLSGLTLAGLQPHDDPILFWGLILSSLAFGLAFVSMTWAQEGIDILKSGDSLASLRPHIRMFVEAAGYRSAEEARAAPSLPLETTPRQWPVWNTAIVSSVIILGTVLVLHMDPGHFVASMVVGLILVVSVWPVCHVKAMTSRFLALGLGILASGAILIRWWDPLEFVIWLTVWTFLAVYSVIRESNYELMASFPRRAQQALQRCYRWLKVALVGRSTAAALWESSTARQSRESPSPAPRSPQGTLGPQA